MNLERDEASCTSTSIVGKYQNLGYELEENISQVDFEPESFFNLKPPKLDNSLPYIPVYTHLITYDLTPIDKPKTPPFLKKLRTGKTMEEHDLLALDPKDCQTNFKDEKTIGVSKKNLECSKVSDARYKHD